MVILAENGGRATLLLLEDAVEITDIVEAAGITNLCHTMRTVHQHSGGMPQADVYRVFRHRLVGMKVEEATESRRRHACQACQIVEADFPLEILVDIFLNISIDLRTERERRGIEDDDIDKHVMIHAERCDRCSDRESVAGDGCRRNTRQTMYAVSFGESERSDRR